MGGNGTCKCTTLQYLGFEIFEIIMLIVLMLIVFKIQGLGKTWFKKWKESKEIAKERKFEKMRAKYDATMSKRGNKVHVETKREPNRELKRETDPVTYEKGMTIILMQMRKPKLVRLLEIECLSMLEVECLSYYRYQDENRSL
jgi:hypothetical protein